MAQQACITGTILNATHDVSVGSNPTKLSRELFSGKLQIADMVVERYHARRCSDQVWAEKITTICTFRLNCNFN